jgi:hypothetical protein
VQLRQYSLIVKGSVPALELDYTSNIILPRSMENSGVSLPVHALKREGTSLLFNSPSLNQVCEEWEDQSTACNTLNRDRAVAAKLVACCLE